jgi:hypothetical protein
MVNDRAEKLIVRALGALKQVAFLFEDTQECLDLLVITTE